MERREVSQIAEETESEVATEAVVKKFMFVNRKAPYGTIYALEGLEVVLISAAFNQDVSLAYRDEPPQYRRQQPQ